MTEVLFGESEAGSMKAAVETPVKTAKKTAKRTDAAGNGREVICLGFHLDAGSIREDADSRYRRELIYSLYAQGQWGPDEDMDAELLGLGGIYANELKRLRAYLAEGRDVRVWYSSAPYAMCGLCHLCSILNEYENEIYAVRLPEYIQTQESAISYSSWGEVDFSEKMNDFLIYEKKMTRGEIRMYAYQWEALREDDSPLRAVINGRVLGVPEDFYDFLIWKNIGRKPVKEALLIGNILGENPVGVGDWWYARRIDALIGQGKIRVTEDSENKYARTICLV